MAVVVAAVLFVLTRFAAMVADLLASPGWFTDEPPAAWLGPVSVGIVIGGWLYAALVVAWSVGPVTWSFRAQVWRHTGSAAWHFLTLPFDVSDEIEERAPGGPGFGSVRVDVTIGDTSWSTSVFPDSKAAAYVLPVKKAVRSAEGIEAGNEVTVTLALA